MFVIRQTVSYGWAHPKFNGGRWSQSSEDCRTFASRWCAAKEMAMLTVRMDVDLYERFKELATEQGQSMNQAAIHLIEQAVAKCPGCQRRELHKMCPAYGTAYYMSGTLFTEEMERAKE